MKFHIVEVFLLLGIEQSSSNRGKIKPKYLLLFY